MLYFCTGKSSCGTEQSQSMPAPLPLPSPLLLALWSDHSLCRWASAIFWPRSVTPAQLLWRRRVTQNPYFCHQSKSRPFSCTHQPVPGRVCLLPCCCAINSLRLFDEIMAKVTSKQTFVFRYIAQLHSHWIRVFCMTPVLQQVCRYVCESTASNKRTTFDLSLICSFKCSDLCAHVHVCDVNQRQGQPSFYWLRTIDCVSRHSWSSKNYGWCFSLQTYTPVQIQRVMMTYRSPTHDNASCEWKRLMLQVLEQQRRWLSSSSDVTVSTSRWCRW